MSGWTTAGGGRAAPDDQVRGLDHALIYLRGETLDNALQRWRRAGFAVDDGPNKVEIPGTAAGIVRFGHEYLVLLAVVDEVAFRGAGPAMPVDPAVRMAARPFALGFDHVDARAYAMSLAARGFDRPPPRWQPYGWDPAHGLAILDQIVPGAAAFVCSFATPKRQWPPVPSPDRPVPPNRIRRWGGVVLVATSPHGQAEAWRRVLAPARPLVDDALGHGFDLAQGRLRWQTAAQWQGWTGQGPWPPRHRYDEIGLLLMESEDPAASAAALSRGGWTVEAAGQDGYFMRPDIRDGVAMHIGRVRG